MCSTLSKREKLFRIIEIVCILLLSFIILQGVRYTVLHFDGTMNYQISENLAKYGEYRSNYEDFGYNGNTGVWFDHKIQTAGTVLYLAAFLNAVFGCAISNMQYSAVIHLIVFLVLLYYLLKRTSKVWISIPAVFAVFLVCCQNAYGGYGEMAAAMYILSSILLFTAAKKRNSDILCIVAGILLGLGYLTKTVSLIAVPAFVLLFVLEFYASKNIRSIFPYLFLATGVLMPVAIFEIYKLSVLGIDSYLYWWFMELSDILGESGASSALADGLSGITKWINNTTLYVETYSIPLPILILLVAVPPVFFTLSAKRHHEINTALILLYIIGITYLVWWIFIVPSARLWWRRAIIGHIFLLVATIGTIGSYVPVLTKKKSVWMTVNCLVAVYLFFIGCTNIKPNIALFKGDMQQKAGIESCVAFINTLPENAVLYGDGWWQAPVIAAEANRTIVNLSENPIIYDNAFFVSDYYMTNLAPGTVAQIVEKYNGVLIYSAQGNNVYKLSLDYPEERGCTLETCGILYGYSEDGWIGESAAFTVSSGPYGNACLRGWYPGSPTGNEIITVKYDGEKVVDYCITNNTIEILFSCEPNQSGVLEIETNFAQAATPPDVRTISFILNELNIS